MSGGDPAGARERLVPLKAIATLLGV